MAIFFPSAMAVVILAALDDGRFHWLPVPWWICVLGYGLLIVGIAGLTWAESVNKFFERTVRIQTDRGHEVIDTGPYRIVRHPGYVSGFFFLVGMSLALGSVWALIPAVLSCVVLVVRTILEDRLLREELAGYKEYTQRVRFRLIPGVW
jgi:protein-S-isoprenylcysteine O-methyltransferase Ste14